MTYLADASREDLLTIIFGDKSLFARFLDRDIDPELDDLGDVRAVCQQWVEDGDETAAA